MHSVRTFCFSLFVAGVVGFGLCSCSPQSPGYGLLAALEGMVTNQSTGTSFPANPLPFVGHAFFLPGQTVNLNSANKASSGGIVVDPSSAGSTLGIATEGNGVPNLVFLYNGNTNPYAVDVNGDGIPDYYLCYKPDGSVGLTTGVNCTGNSVTVVSGQGFDTTGNGVVDNPMMAREKTDTIPPSSSITPPPGSYGGPQSVTISCADNVAPGNLSYTLDGSTPTFSPVHGTITNPPQTKFTVGGNGDGTYTVEFRCRDLAGNVEAVHTATYIVNHTIPNVTIVNPLGSAYLSTNSGAINSTTFSWKSNQAGSYSVRLGATGCTDGTIVASGSVAANSAQTTFVNASQLVSGVNSIFICVTAGQTGKLSLTVTLDTQPPTVTPNPGGGGYGSSPVSVQLNYADNVSTSSGYLVAYTIDGSLPSINTATQTITNGIAYSGSTPISVKTTTTVRYLAMDNAGNLSSPGSAVYTIDPNVPTVTINSYPSTQAVNGSTDAQINWQFSVQSGASYKVLLGGNKCTQVQTPVSGSGGSGSTTTNYQGPSGVLYSTPSDCECNNGTALTGSSTAYASGNVVVSSPNASLFDIQENVPVVTTIANLNLTVGKNSVVICVANEQNQPHYGSVVGSIWKDTLAPTVSSVTPSGGATGVNPKPGTITLTFSEPMNQSLTPGFSIAAYTAKSGQLWQTLDITNIRYSWTSPDTLQVQLPWKFFPENALLQWTLTGSSMKDVMGNVMASNASMAFTTTTYESASGTWFGAAAPSYNATPVTVFPGFPSDSVTIDNSTQLYWKTVSETVPTGASALTFYQAVNACSYLNAANANAGFAGRTDWRLPSSTELQSIQDFTIATVPPPNAAAPAINSTAFPSTARGWHWTSTVFAGDPSQAWYADFGMPDTTFVSGLLSGANPPYAAMYLRCVAGR